METPQGFDQNATTIYTMDAAPRRDNAYTCALNFIELYLVEFGKLFPAWSLLIRWVKSQQKQSLNSEQTLSPLRQYLHIDVVILYTNPCLATRQRSG